MQARLVRMAAARRFVIAGVLICVTTLVVGVSHSSGTVGAAVPVPEYGSLVTHSAGSSCSNCVIETLAVGDSPQGLAYDTSNGNVYVGNYEGDNLSVINGSSNAIEGSVTVQLSTRDVTYVSTNGHLYVDTPNPATGLGNNMDIVSTSSNSIVGSITFSGSDPISPCFDQSNGNLYVPMHYGEQVAVVNVSSNLVTSYLPEGAYAGSATCDAANGYVYVANEDSDTITVINGATNEVIGTIFSESLNGPYEAALDPENGELFVGNTGTTTNDYVGNTVSVIDTTSDTVVASIAVGASPTWLSYDPADGEVYVTNYNSNNVSVIDPTSDTVVDSIAVGQSPLGVLFDPASCDEYVSNSNSDTVSVVSAGNASGCSVGGTSPPATSASGTGGSWFNGSSFLFGLAIGGAATGGVVALIMRRQPATK